MNQVKVKTNSSTPVTDFRPVKPMHIKPVIIGEKTAGGTKFYIDDKGKHHEAKAFDRMYGVIKMPVSPWKFKGKNPNHRKSLK